MHTDTLCFFCDKWQLRAGFLTQGHCVCVGDGCTIYGNERCRITYPQKNKEYTVAPHMKREIVEHRINAL